VTNKELDQKLDKLVDLMDKKQKWNENMMDIDGNRIISNQNRIHEIQNLLVNMFELLKEYVGEDSKLSLRDFIKKERAG